MRFDRTHSVVGATAVDVEGFVDVEPDDVEAERSRCGWSVKIGMARAQITRPLTTKALR